MRVGETPDFESPWFLKKKNAVRGKGKNQGPVNRDERFRLANLKRVRSVLSITAIEKSKS